MGKIIVIYGAPNLGKTTQAKLLTEKLNSEGMSSVYFKYPIYDLAPTGPIINEVLRHGRQMDDLTLQTLYAQNRFDHEPNLFDWVDNRGFNAILEDYTGTGIAWGITKGIDVGVLEEINKPLIKEHLSIWLDGQRYTSGIERGHRFESDSNQWERARAVHENLAIKYGWVKVDASQNKENVAKDIWNIVNKIF